MLEKYKGNLVAQLDDLASSPIIYNSNYAIANVLHKNNTYVYNSGINFLDNLTKATFTEKEGDLDVFPNIVNLFITSPPTLYNNFLCQIFTRPEFSYGVCC